MNPKTNETDALLKPVAAEAHGVLADMEGALVALETRPDNLELLDGLLRSACRLDNLAQRVGLGPARALTTELVPLLEHFCAATTPLGVDHIALLQSTLDALLEATANADVDQAWPHRMKADLGGQRAAVTSPPHEPEVGGGYRTIELALRSIAARRP
jgi:chemotaxis protein histidine kinase CheA